MQQQFGMAVGIPGAGQVRAIGMLNLRGERSDDLQGRLRSASSAGPLPPGAPAVCEEFRRQPDALERAAELDAQYGRNPDLRRMPMYCIPFSFKDPIDIKDMRSTGGADAGTTWTFRRATTPWSRSCGTRARSSTPKPIPRSTTAAVRAIRAAGIIQPGASVDARVSAQHLGRQSVQLVRHDSRGVDRVELRVGRLGRARTS